MRGPRVFQTRPFSRWAKDFELTDEDLCRAVEEMVAGLVDADLGGGLVKKRIRLAGRGKRGGARVIVATRRSDRWFFVFGFAKNDRESIDHDERCRLAMPIGQARPATSRPFGCGTCDARVARCD